jgi:hypothetical protein
MTVENASELFNSYTTQPILNPNSWTKRIPNHSTFATPPQSRLLVVLQILSNDITCSNLGIKNSHHIQLTL